MKYNIVNNIVIINTEDVITNIAALAGCDYTLPHDNQRHIDTARGLIVRSNLGGLKGKDRSRPTSRGAIVVVLQFVSYFIQRKEMCSLSSINRWLIQHFYTLNIYYVTLKGVHFVTDD